MSIFIVRRDAYLHSLLPCQSLGAGSVPDNLYRKFSTVAGLFRLWKVDRTVTGLRHKDCDSIFASLLSCIRKQCSNSILRSIRPVILILLFVLMVGLQGY